MGEELIKIVLGEFEISLTKEKVLKMIDYGNLDAAFDACGGSFYTDVDENEYQIYGGDVNGQANFINALDSIGKYVVIQKWYVYDEKWSEEEGKTRLTDAFEVEFVNCECPDQMKEYYGKGHFIKERDDKFAKSDSEYFSIIVVEDEREIEQDIEVIKLSNWDYNDDTKWRC